MSAQSSNGPPAGSLGAFLVFGPGTEALAVAILVVMFRRRGWTGKGRS